MDNKPKSKNKGCLIILGVIVAIFGVLITIGFFSKDSINAEQDRIEAEKNQTKEEKIRLDSISKIEIERLDSEIKNKEKNIIVKYDDIEDRTWYYPKSLPNYSNTMAFYSYAGMRNSDKAVWKRLLIRYHGDDWLFINSITVKTDSNTYRLDALDSKRDHNADVWEWIDIEQTPVNDIMIDDIIESKTTKIRFTGTQYHKDWTLGSKEINGLKSMKEFYNLLENRYILLKDISQN